MSEIRVNKLVDEAGTGAVELSQGATLPSGKTISGSGSITVDTSGNAATATALETARTIAGVSFDGTGNISLNNNAITNGAGYITNSVTGDFTVSGNVSVGGTLTYEDVTSVDSVGVITARAGIRVGAGQSIGSDSGTVVYYGDGSNLTGVAAEGSGGGITTTASSPSANSVVTLNLTNAQHHQLTLSAGITTISCTGGTFGESHSVTLIQPSSGIATVGFSDYFLIPSGSVPSMSEGGSKIDLVSFVVHRVGAAGTQLLASAGLNYQ